MHARDALGGDLYATVLAALRFQVPMHHILVTHGTTCLAMSCLAGLVITAGTYASRSSWFIVLMHRFQCLKIAFWYPFRLYAPSNAACVFDLLVHQVKLLTPVGGTMQFPSQTMQEAGIHGHFFVNGGNLSLLSGTGRSMKQAVTEDFMQSWRWSTVCYLQLHLVAVLAVDNRHGHNILNAVKLYVTSPVPSFCQVLCGDGADAATLHCLYACCCQAHCGRRRLLTSAILFADVALCMCEPNA